MLKFKRLNVIECAKKYNVPIYSLDIARQTTIERNIKEANKYHYTKDELTTYLLFNFAKILDMTIKEEE